VADISAEPIIGTPLITSSSEGTGKDNDSSDDSQASFTEQLGNTL